MNILDLFSGIGGFSLAVKRSGFEIENHYSSEVDKYAEQIYRKQFPGAIQLGDICKIGNEHGKIDIITGGFPCQSFSIAGKRRGFEDTRGTMFFEIERLAGFYRPAYMVLENVKGLFSHDGGNTIRIILDKLRRLDYSVQLLLLNTVDFGIPQNRERCFFICAASGERQPEISNIREAKRENTFSTDVKIIDRHGKDKDKSYASTLSNGGHGGGNHSDMDLIQVGTLRTHKDGEGFRKMQSKVCPTLSSNSFEHNNHVFNETIIRRLTPIECERLQDYPDNWTQYGINDNGEQVEISDTQRYKTLGNSITVRVAEEIFKAIKEVI